ncbi:hypothetical protein [uncultured Nocardioides sp.]|uniref:hypothetical protein n=1 Tax=uncultured Nocardioides sp. TaxID=198441 RepID=UPI0026310E58|nr:hypothetical protein [uncultured Nocardioides sp.]
MRRLLTLLAVLGLAATGVVVAVVLGTGGDDGTPTGDPAASQTPVVVPEGAIEVVVLVDESTDSSDAERAIGLVTEGARMWQGGLAGLAEEGSGEGSGQDGAQELVVRTERVAPDGTAQVAGAEIVVVVASDTASAGGAVLDTGCTTYDDVFAFRAWREREGFDSHHRLPEGTFDATCDGEPVCLAVNATFTAGGVAPMEAFGLVGDELGHCLGRTGA